MAATEYANERWGQYAVAVHEYLIAGARGSASVAAALKHIKPTFSLVGLFVLITSYTSGVPELDHGFQLGLWHFFLISLSSRFILAVFPAPLKHCT